MRKIEIIVVFLGVYNSKVHISATCYNYFAERKTRRHGTTIIKEVEKNTRKKEEKNK